MLTSSPAQAQIWNASEPGRAPWEDTQIVFIDDLAKLLRVSRSTIERRRHEGSFPIPELVAIDRRPRWSRRAVLAYLATSPKAIRSPRGRPRSREAWR